jgi:serine/threonine protein phosphatase 1
VTAPPLAMQPAPAALPPGQRVYAVGDVHGCADRLAALHALIAADLAARPVAESTLVHLGDYVDRGPDSAGVIALLDAGPPATRRIDLMGNHEQMLLDALDAAAGGGDPGAIRHWLVNGAAATLASWGVPAAADPESWAGLVPAGQIARIRTLALSHRAGGYLFVHAGIRPGVPPERQSRHDMLWIREPFLLSDARFGVVVVHGHTPGPAPVIRPNRIGIDTGAVLGGALTCLVLEEDRLGFLAA